MNGGRARALAVPGPWLGPGLPDPGSPAYSAHLLRKIPDVLRETVASAFHGVREADSLLRANLLLQDLVRSLPDHTLRLGADEDAIRKLAIKNARSVRSLSQLSPSHALAFGTALAKQAGINIEDVSASIFTPQGLLYRLCDEAWWRRNLRKATSRSLEAYLRQSGKVNRRAGLYISDPGFARWNDQCRRNRSLLETLIAVSELGVEVPLKDIVNASLANPRNRRCELMARIAGFEKIAREFGHVAEFYTLTAPSRMHAALGKNGARNPRWDKSTPRDVQKYFIKLGSRLRAKLARDGLRPYGFRIAEPHHDGTPHWHFLLFMPPEVVEQVRAVFRKYALAVDPDEPGAQSHRFRAEAMDPRKGTAIGYVAKYIAKGIDGYGLPNESGDLAQTTAARVRACASLWSFRQFQQIGGPPASIYRELRRLSVAPQGLLEDLRRAADAGDWAEFVRLMGGPNSRRRDAPVRLAKRQRFGTNRYQEPLRDEVCGLEYGPLTIVSRFHKWQLHRKRGPKCGHDPPEH